MKLFRSNINCNLRNYYVIGLFFVSLLLLTLSFYNNFFKIVNEGWFKIHQWDSERFIVGRLVESREKGISYHAFSLGSLGGGWLIKRQTKRTGLITLDIKKKFMQV